MIFLFFLNFYVLLCLSLKNLYNNIIYIYIYIYTYIKRFYITFSVKKFYIINFIIEILYLREKNLVFNFLKLNYIDKSIPVRIMAVRKI